MYQFIKNVAISVLMIGLSVTVVADDIEIIDNAFPVDSNVLFIMDVSGSMEWDTGNTNTVPADPANSRLSILRGALSALLSDPEMTNINVGISSFAGNKNILDIDQTAHGISYPISSIDADAQKILDSNPLFTHPGTSYMPVTSGETTRDYLQVIANTWDPFGGTPIVDALFEAALYFRGDKVNWGRHDPSKIRSAHPSTYKGLLKDVTTTKVVTVISNPVCTGAGCDPLTKSCSTNAVTQTCSTPSCGTTCTGPTTTRVTCNDGDTSCGNGVACINQLVSSQVRDCITNSEPLCRWVHPTWYDCKTVEVTSCTTTCPSGIKDEFGVCVSPSTNCVVKKHKQCKEDTNRYVCDANSYACTSDVETCTHQVSVDQTVTTTELTGDATFVSPITEKCPSNGIILLSDGLPSVNRGSALVSNMIGPTYNNSCDSGVDMGRCGPELTKFMAEEDNNASITGDQFVKTFTIGFALSDPAPAAYLQSLADAGDGLFVNAESTQEGLVKAFKTALSGIAGSRARSFSSPSYTIDTGNPLVNGESVYVPVFDRSSGSSWAGNLKKYEFKKGKLYGKDSLGKKVLATDASGKLLDDVNDMWALSSKSESAVTSGGFANLINPATRIIYTDKGSSLVSLSSINFSKFNAADDTEKNSLIKFIRGQNSDGTTRHHMGDTIHSNPIQMKTKTDDILFIGTNEGYLHAINGKSGKEIFAYMPSELLKNIKLQSDKSSFGNHVYGVDGPMTLWIDDKNRDGIKSSTEKAMLFFGLRRGGKAYYALDVTDPASPKLAWKITNKGSFSKLGYTWSKPILAKIQIKSLGVKDVLIFGGGYVDDNGLENGTKELDNSGTGANIYIVDAKTGKLLKKFGSPISYAVPSDIRVVDMDRNGLADRFYFGDTGANVWRVDLHADKKDPYNLATSKLTHFASLGGKSGKDNRKFFNEPDVSIFKQHGKLVLSIGIGSGKRPNPLNSSIDDHFFMLLDENVTKAPKAGFKTITIDKLENAPLAAGVELVRDLSKPTGKKGWKLNLNPVKSLTGLTGEKVLSTSLTYQNKLMFTTFGVDSITTTKVNNVTCELSNKNKANLYVLDLLTGKSVLDLDGDNVISDSTDSSVIVSSGEILGTPQIAYGDFIGNGTGGSCTDKECTRTFSIQAGKGASVAGSETKTNKPIPANKKLPRVFWLDSER